MKICKHCGKTLDQNTKFCPHCGTAVPVEETVFTAPATPAPTETAVQKNNGFAIASLVLGISSFFTWLCCLNTVTCILAIVFGVIALTQIKNTLEKGRGMAIAGLVCGILAFVIFIVGSVCLAVFSEVWATEYDGEYDYYYDGGMENFYDEFSYSSEFDPEDFSADLEIA